MFFLYKCNIFINKYYLIYIEKVNLSIISIFHCATLVSQCNGFTLTSPVTTRKKVI